MFGAISQQGRRYSVGKDVLERLQTAKKEKKQNFFRKAELKNAETKSTKSK